MASEPIRVGVIGLGRSGWGIHVEGIAQYPNFKVVAVADPEADRRGEAEAKYGCRPYADPAGLIGDDEVELVVVATPSHTHAPLSCAALEAGKHVLVEKPMASSAADAAAMLESAGKNARILTVFQLLRKNGAFCTVQEIIARGVLGPIQVIKIGSYSYGRRHDWQTLRKFGGGQLNNSGAHFIDQALLLAGGQWHKLDADLRRIASAGDADDYCRVSFRGVDGIALQIEFGNSVAIGLPAWHIIGKYGAAISEGTNFLLRYFDPISLPQPVADEGPAARRSYSTGEELPWVEETVPMATGDAAALFYEALHDSIRNDAPLLVPPEQSLNLINLLDACREQSGF